MVKTIDDGLAEVIRNAARQRGLSLRAIAEAADVPYERFLRLLRRQREPKLDEVSRIIAVLLPPSKHDGQAKGVPCT
jgi:DNA-binding phage protein